ncbi:uncharacterized protein LOC121240751 [Juglans microcarpa x Juglans regia]|uniref:uncharacterized protein LOC121240751 n=1 Tax=Juglans microcarpa x Juglans regia TaxID=2249226 RepID=UPI001B7F697D|nr:uncharacterized protein LOC121240751 [Juglans microcarpa x Juglans regia]
MPVPSSTKPTTISLRKQSASTVKLRNRRRAIKRLIITAPKTRSYRPYFLRSSRSSSYKYTMDDVEVVRDREIWSGGLEEMLVDILYQETLEGKLVGSSQQGSCIMLQRRNPLLERRSRQLEEELRARGPVLGSGVGLDSTIDLDDISMTPSTQGGVSQRMPPRRRRGDSAGPSFSPELSAAIQTLASTSKQRANLDAKMFELCSSKRSRGEGSNIGSDAGFSSVAQCMKYLEDITPPLPPDVHLRAVKAFMNPNVLTVFQNMTPSMRIDWVWSLG